MHPVCEQTLKAWIMIAKADRVPKDEISSAVWVALTDQAPPKGIGQIKNAIDMSCLMYKRATGTDLSPSEVQTLRVRAVALWESPPVSAGGAKLLIAAPWVAIALAIAAVSIAGLSWVVLALAVIAKIWNGYARWLAGQSHPAAQFHALVALLSLPLSVVASILHASKTYLLP